VIDTTRLGSTLFSSTPGLRIAAAESFEPGDPAHLWPHEAHAVRDARWSRRAEFAAVRACARAALAELGVQPTAIVPSGAGPTWARRAPRWPPDVVGSMTHTAGYAAAVVALDRDVASLGIDAEANAPLPEGILEYTTGEEERSAIERLSRQDGTVAWDRLVFSMKESVFKTWYPLMGTWLGFEQCVVTVGPEGTFSAALADGGLLVDQQPLRRLTGVWELVPGQDSEMLVTAVVVPQPCVLDDRRLDDDGAVGRSGRLVTGTTDDAQTSLSTCAPETPDTTRTGPSAEVGS